MLRKTLKGPLERAKRSFTVGDYEACAFWSHQAVEFALKALVIFCGENPPRTHNLRRLYEMAREKVTLDEQLLVELTLYYSVSKYLDIFMGVPQVHRNTAERFLNFAKDVIQTRR